MKTIADISRELTGIYPLFVDYYPYIAEKTFSISY